MLAMSLLNQMLSPGGQCFSRWSMRCRTDLLRQRRTMRPSCVEDALMTQDVKARVPSKFLTRFLASLFSQIVPLHLDMAVEVVLF